MTRAIQRMGDVNTGGGVITSIPQGTVFANSKTIAVNGSTGTPHQKHTGWATASGVGTVFINSIPVNVQGNTDTCGHQRAGGSPNVFVG